MDYFLRRTRVYSVEQTTILLFMRCIGVTMYMASVCDECFYREDENILLRV